MQELKLLHNHYISYFLLVLTVTLLIWHMRRFWLTAKRFIIEHLTVHILLLRTGTYAGLTELQEPLRYVQVLFSFVERNSKERLYVLETILTVWDIDVKEFILHKTEKFKSWYSVPSVLIVLSEFHPLNLMNRDMSMKTEMQANNANYYISCYLEMI